MLVARILYPVEVLGYGKRIGVWVSGCPHRCKLCSNPELQVPDQKYEISLKNVIYLVSNICERLPVDGFTITGGEPFFNINDLDALVEELYNINDDVLIYSGYTLDELRKMDNKAVDRILAKISVLIDGRYIAECNTGTPLRGSYNQVVHIMNDSYAEMYDTYSYSKDRELQNFHTRDGIVSVGIHKDGFLNDMYVATARKGLVINE